MSGRSSGRSKKVKVWVRTRPTANFADDMIDLQDGKIINIHCKRDARRGVVNNQILDWSFKLDGILHNSSQEQVIETVAKDTVSASLDGYNGTLMCYGQTGAGKTFTMAGATENFRHRGIVPRSLSQLYREVEERSDVAINIRISYLEIYNETMFDLLSTLPESMNAAAINPMTVVEDENGVYVKGLSCHLAQNEEEALNLLFEGETNRAIAAHTLNQQSSRSHCIFTVYIESRSRVASNAKYTMSKLNFVDLAGSERLGKTLSEGKTKEEAMYINKSLSFLEQTVIALADRRREHIPFRQTKLTHCLKDSIGGRCNTLLIANIWGEATQIEETISTLRFATRMMCVSSEPAINVHFDPNIMVARLEKEITSLRRELAMHDTLTNRNQITYEPLSEQQRYETRQQVRSYLDANLDDIDIVNVRQIQGVFEAFRDICNQMEKDLADGLRQKYTLVDKTDPAAIAAAQQAGLPINDEGELVGEPDRSSFGIGTASPSSKPAASSVINAKKKDYKRGKSKDRNSPTPKVGSPVQSTKGHTEGSMSQTPSGEKDDKREEAGTPSSLTGEKAPLQKPSTPPPRTEAFEEFKREAGSEINRILKENKDILSSKKKRYADLARQINSTKIEIDNSRVKLDQLKEERESAAGAMYNTEGDLVISEEEYLEIRRLKDLKAAYRTDFEELKHNKSEVQYCQRLVDQCRQKLIHEFDMWYSESFLTGVETEPQSSVDAGHGTRAGVHAQGKQDSGFEDEQEKFDRLQMELLLENPDSAAFFNAQMRTQRRKTYEASMRQAQPNMKRPQQQQQQQQQQPHPGTPTRMIKNPPPTMLSVQY